MTTYGQAANPYAVAQAPADARAEFIRKTYAHLAGAVALFIILEFLLVSSPLTEAMLRFISANQYGWLMLLGGFILVGWMARSMAEKVESPGLQYLGLGLYVVAEAVIFAPLLFIAARFSSPEVIPSAGILTVMLFLALTTTAFTTRKDFSFLGPILMVGGFVALGFIVCSAVFGFTLGLIFSAVMIVFASAAILYDTSKIIHHYRTDQHVAASLSLFASVALLFWYILRLMMILNRR